MKTYTIDVGALVVQTIEVHSEREDLAICEAIEEVRRYLKKAHHVDACEFQVGRIEVQS